MSDFLNEYNNRVILVQDILYKLHYAINNAAYISPTITMFDNNSVERGTPTASPVFCGGDPGDRSMNSLTGGNATTLPAGPGGTGGLPATPTAAHVVNLVAAWMATYAKVQKIRINDTSNRTSPVTVVTFLNSPDITTANQVSSAVSSAGSAVSLNETSINNFINQCQAIWKTYCVDGAAKMTYNVAYCHSNHCSHSNHGSRGRR